jgi:hypothetical protein
MKDPGCDSSGVFVPRQGAVASRGYASGGRSTPQRLPGSCASLFNAVAVMRVQALASLN